MDRNMHYARNRRTLAIKSIELVANDIAEFLRREVRGLERVLVIDAIAVRYRDQRLFGDMHQIGLIVVRSPVRDIVDAFLGQMVQRFPCLLQAWAKPAARPGAGDAFDRVEGRPDHRALFLRWNFVQPAGVRLIVTHPLPAALVAFLDDLGMLKANITVKCHAGAQLVAIENLHNAEYAHAVAIVPHGPSGNVGNLAGADPTRPRFERKELDIGDDPERDPGSIRPL